MTGNMMPMLMGIALLMIGPTLVGPAQAATSPKESEQVVVQVKGAGCPFCVFGIEKWFSKIDGVKDVEMDLETGEATLTLKPGAKVSEAELHEAVKKAGFTPAAIKGITYKDSGE